MPEDITFEHPGWSLSVDNPNSGEWQWTNEEGLVVILHRLGVDKGLRSRITNLKSTRDYYRTSFAERGIGLIECDLLQLEGIPAARAIGKMLGKPHGVTYAGTIALPLRRESYVFTVIAREFGITGVRETAVMLKMMHELENQGYALISPSQEESGSEPKSGTSEMGWKNAQTGSVIWWAQDPYDPDHVAPCPRNLAEAPEHDAGFPRHPLSRAREVLRCVAATVRLSDDLKKRASGKGGWWPW